MRRGAALVLCVLLAAPAASARRSPAPAWTTAARWSAIREPKDGKARAIGSYAGGCVQGAVGLPDAGPGFEVLHRGRHRYFGHPDLVEFVRRLAGAAQARGLPVLLVGDLSQPRGGPTPTDHGSHQIGLDVDVSYTRPRDAIDRALAPDLREKLAFPVVYDLRAASFTADWSPHVSRLLELAAEDASVDRIFVNPSIKRALCETTRAPWLRHLRPWWGHHDHFHVRLKCPAGSASCRAQPALPEGEGCGKELAWWFSKAATRPKPPPKKKPPAAARLPAACKALLE